MSSSENASTRAVLESLQPGQVCKGPVSAVTSFGVFVDLGGAVGLITVANLSWQRFEHPSEVARVGDEVVASVLSVDLDREQASLSLKELLPDPLLAFARTRFGEAVVGSVTKTTPIGSFVHLEGDIEGLLPLSAIESSGIKAEVGDSLAVRVDYVNVAMRRITVSLADATDGNGS
ncbi:S1 RNA-binding domain-containing protein [Streptomyces sp. NPDC005863]|uniref:S1 RNA-binding domain-containing protein n=1 Tax=Streptomyces sp. NPDC005863 TaxID=3364735 RepID=UPI0036B8D2C3